MIEVSSTSALLTRTMIQLLLSLTVLRYTTVKCSNVIYPLHNKRHKVLYETLFI